MTSRRVAGIAVLIVPVLLTFGSGWFGDIEVLLRLLVVGAVVAFGVGMWWRERALSGPLRRIAAAKGWSFSKKSPGLSRRWRGEPFEGGTDHQATSVVRGRVADRPFTAFNLNVKRSNGRDEVTAYYSVVALDMAVDLPVVEIRSTLGGVEQALGLSRIEFEHEGFNRRYRVTAADPKYASDILSPRTIELLIAGRVVNVRVGGGRAVAWATGRLEVHELLGWSRALVGTVDLIPDFVWKDQTTAPGATSSRFDPYGSATP